MSSYQGVGLTPVRRVRLRDWCSRARLDANHHRPPHESAPRHLVFHNKGALPPSALQSRSRFSSSIPLLPDPAPSTRLSGLLVLSSRSPSAPLHPFAMDASTKQFISDNVLRLMGQSDSATVEFIAAMGELSSLVDLTRLSCGGTYDTSPTLGSLSTASTAKKPEKLYRALLSVSLPDSPETESFASALYDRIPHASSKAKSAHSLASGSTAVGPGQRYGLLLEEDVVSGGGALSGGGKKDKGKSRAEKEERRAAKADRKREKEQQSSSGDRPQGAKRDRGAARQRDDEGAWESDEEEKQMRKRRREEEEDEWRRQDEGEEAARWRDSGRDDDGNDDNGSPPPPEETEEERRERERLEDIAERDAFAARIRDRDKDKTKKLVTDHSSVAAESEAAKRRALGDDASARAAAMPDLRLRSRQEYLTKREAQQMDLLRLEIIDEENLFHGMQISKREQRELDRKKEVLRLMEERMKIDDGYDGYQLPEDYITEQGKLDSEKKRNALYKRYEENKKDDKNFTTDIAQWEKSQTDAANYRTGALDKVVIEEHFDFVFDASQQIEFLPSDTILKGDDGHEMSAKDKALKQAIEEAETKGGVDPFYFPCELC